MSQDQHEVGQEPDQRRQREGQQELRQRGGQRGAAPDEREDHQGRGGGGDVGDQGQDGGGGGEAGEPEPADQPVLARGVRPGVPGLAAPLGRGPGDELPGLDLARARPNPAPPAPRHRSWRRASACCGPRRVAPGPIRMAPMWTTSPSIHQPDRSTSGSTLQPLPSEQQPGDGRQRVQLDVLADLRPERPRVVGHPGRAGQADGAGEVLDLFRQPEPQVHPAGPRIRSRHHVAQQEPGGGDGEQHPARRG